jgi:choline kinase
MRAVILAAGAGIRLRPMTDRLPKCLLPVSGQPILAHQLSALIKCNIDNITIVTGHCSDKIKNYVADKKHIKILKNKDYAITNNAYSLWLARDFIFADPEGCIVINSDLIFHPSMLRFLINHPAPDAMIIDRNVDFQSDMLKAQMEGDKIIHMSKDLPLELTAAEAVGPVKLSPTGAKKFIDYIGSLIAKGDKNHWFFYMLSDFAKKYHFVGATNPGYLWTEIDTPDDWAHANNKIPYNFTELDIYEN